MILATQFEVAQPDANGQDIHLAAIVVDVVFTLNFVTRGGQYAGQAGSVCCAPAVPDVQRPGRVGGHVLQRYAVAAGPQKLAVVFFLAHGVLDHAGKRTLCR